MENCTNCQKYCESCQEVCCPQCGSKGLKVPNETVKSLSKQKLTSNSQFYLCVNKACDIAYFNTENEKINLKQIKVPIWFKTQKVRYMICYCRYITLNDIKKAVVSIDKDDITIEDVLCYLKKEEIETDCLHHNPTGLCCTKLFTNAIKFALTSR